jgi:5'-3' exonuclease
MKTTVIIDGNNLIHRTFWTAKTQSRRTDTDTPEQLSNFHIYFTINAVVSYVSKYSANTTIIVWDEKPEYRTNTRKTEFTEYKANRTGDSKPHENNEAIKKILAHLGIKSMFPRELEADDIISYLTTVIDGKKVIISVDKDFIQCINKDVMLYDPISKQEYRLDTFKEQTGWKDTSEWLSAKCCMGDKSDNVPGIPGFGKVKTTKYIGGEITLTEDQLNIYERNRSLFCLQAIHKVPEEAEYYNQQLDAPMTPSWPNFVAECKDREYNSLLKKKESIYTLFFLKNKLIQMLT